MKSKTMKDANKSWIIEKVGFFVILVMLIILVTIGRASNVNLSGFEMLIGFILAMLIR